MSLTSTIPVSQSSAAACEIPETAIEYLEGKTVKVTLRDTTALQGRLERIGWMNADSEAVSYLCLRMDSDAHYVLAAHGISTRSGIVFIPWDWVAYVVMP